MALVPWTEFSAGESPFVMVFERMGLPAAALVINFVVITAAASSCNSGIFSTGRMLYTLAHFGQAPKAFGRVNKNHVLAFLAMVAIFLGFDDGTRIALYVAPVSFALLRHRVPVRSPSRDPRRRLTV